MFFRLLSLSEPAWPLLEHERVHGEYLRRRNWKKELRMRRTLEAGVSLVLAERFRVAQNQANAAELVRFAVENLPGHQRSLELDARFDEHEPIEWMKLLAAQKEEGAL